MNTGWCHKTLFQNKMNFLSFLSFYLVIYLEILTFSSLRQIGAPCTEYWNTRIIECSETFDWMMSGTMAMMFALWIVIRSVGSFRSAFPSPRTSTRTPVRSFRSAFPSLRTSTRTSVRSHLNEWAHHTTTISTGTVLVGRKEYFLDVESPRRAELISKFSLPDTLDQDKVNLLPVVLLTSVMGGKDDRDDTGDKGGRIEGLLIGRRTGYLCGDLGTEDGNNSTANTNESVSSILKYFMTQPLFFGGTAKGDDADSLSRLDGTLHMVHKIPREQQLEPLGTLITPDGIFAGGFPGAISDIYSQAPPPPPQAPPTGFDILLFVQSSVWESFSALSDEVEDGVWDLFLVSKEVIFSPEKKIREVLYKLSEIEDRL